MKYDESERDYVPSVLDLHDTSCVTTGEWFPSQTILPEHLVTVQMRETLQALLADEVSVMLSIAVEFGTVGFNGETVEVKYARCGRVIGCDKSLKSLGFEKFEDSVPCSMLRVKVC